MSPSDICDLRLRLSTGRYPLDGEGGVIISPDQLAICLVWSGFLLVDQLLIGYSIPNTVHARQNNIN